MRGFTLVCAIRQHDQRQKGLRTAQECVFGLTLQIQDIRIVVTVHVCADRYLRSKESAKIEYQKYRNKGTKWQRHKVVAVSSVPLCLCASVPLCLYFDS